MSDAPGPIPFTDDCSLEHVPVDSEDAAAIQPQRIAYDGPLVHRPSAYNRGYVPVHGLSTYASMTDSGDGNLVEPLPETNRKRQGSASIDREDCNNVLEPLSCPDVAHDSESAPEPEVRPLLSDSDLAEPLEGNRVRKRSSAATTRSTTGHVSHACDSSNKLPISSSDHAEEQEDKVMVIWYALANSHNKFRRFGDCTANSHQ